MPENRGGKPAEPAVVAANEAIRRRFPFDDTRDLHDARRGFLGTAGENLVRAADGRVVWDLDAYGFLARDCPDTANPSLWRQSRLAADHGLFEVVPGVYQVRGFDLSNMTLVEGERGVFVIDPLLCAETAAAGLALYRAHRGDRPVSGVLYTHSHADHFGGVRGVVGDAEVAAGLPVIAPVGFLEHAVSENVYAGTAMNRRAAYMYGAALPKGERGQIGAGLGQTTSTGSVGLIPPTLDITHTGQTETVDGVRMVFQLTPGTEAPAELNIHFPDHAALCMAENATHNLHNLLTLRGAQVRDPRVWARYLTEAATLFGAASDVAFASHHWPVWGRDRVLTYLSEQRDLYAYLHDQTLRLLNQGLTALEIAETIEMPPALERAWHTHGYYGSVSHNAKAVYQRYLGWFDGNPAHLWEHPPAAAARRYVEFMGGADEVVRRAQRSFADGDFRWVAQVVHHVLFADPEHAGARRLQADALEQLGYGSENGTWRNFYLTGALELRHGAIGTPTSTVAPDLLAALTLDQLCDALAIRVDGPRSWNAVVTVRFDLAAGEPLTLRLLNGVLIHTTGADPATAPAPDATFALDEATLRAVLLGATTPHDLADRAGVTATGDPTKLAEPGDPYRPRHRGRPPPALHPYSPRPVVPAVRHRSGSNQTAAPGPPDRRATTMSDHPSPAHHPAPGRPDDRPGSSGPPANSAWATGGATLAAVLLLVNGALLVLQGIAAIAEDDVYVRHDSYLYRISLTGWGWTLLALGALLLATGCGILTGRLWARATGITLAALSLVAQFLFLPYAPVWSVVVMALDLFVIWALATYQGDRVG